VTYRARLAKEYPELDFTLNGGLAGAHHVAHVLGNIYVWSYLFVHERERAHTHMYTHKHTHIHTRTFTHTLNGGLAGAHYVAHVLGHIYL